MNLRSSYDGGILKIYFEGELDHHAAKKTVAEIESMIDGHLPCVLVLDLGKLTFMDSSGIAVMLKAYRRMNELEGILCIENVKKQPRRVLDASGIDRIIKITASAMEA